jgi:hypothetical protein
MSVSKVPPYLEQTAEQYKIDEWATKVHEREKEYFRGIDDFKSRVKAITNRDPGEERIIEFLMLVIEGDGTFTGHIMKWKGGSALTEEKFWEQLYRAGAHMLLTAYTESCERNEWPEGP